MFGQIGLRGNLLRVFTVCSDLSVRKLRIIMIIIFIPSQNIHWRLTFQTHCQMSLWHLISKQFSCKSVVKLFYLATDLISIKRFVLMIPMFFSFINFTCLYRVFTNINLTRAYTHFPSTLCFCLSEKYLYISWASSRENLSSGFATR